MMRQKKRRRERERDTEREKKMNKDKHVRYSKNKCFGWGRRGTCIKNFSSGHTVSVHLLYDVACFLTNTSEDIEAKLFGTQQCSTAPSIAIRAPSANSSSTCSASNVSSHSNIGQTHSSTSTCQHNTCSGAATSTWLQISIQKWTTHTIPHEEKQARSAGSSSFSLRVDTETSIVFLNQMLHITPSWNPKTRNFKKMFHFPDSRPQRL